MAEDVSGSDQPLPEESPSPDLEEEKPTDPADAVQKVIDYLEGVRQEEKQEEEEKKAAEEAEKIRMEEERKAAEAEQAEAEQKAAEEAAQREAEALEEAAELKAIAVEQDRLNATYTSNTNVIYGYAEKYKYYYVYDVPYTDGYYTRYDRYIYCWDGWPAFELSGNTLKFSGDALFCTALYNGSTTIQTVSESINVGGNRVNVYSNIDILAYPSIYQVNKSAYKSVDEIIQTIVCISALLVGCFITKRFVIDG